MKDAQMKQCEGWKEWTGAAADQYFDGHKAAEAIWGEKLKDRNCGLTAFAYLWRRFGPPMLGSDDHKELCCYYLTTNDPDVMLWVSPRGSGLEYGVGYMVRKSVLKPLENLDSKRVKGNINRAWKWWIKQHPELCKMKKTDPNFEKHSKEVSEMFWKDFYGGAKMPKKLFVRRQDYPLEKKIKSRIQKATNWAMKELLRPVFIRDVPTTIFGVIPDSEVGAHYAEHSEYAGFGLVEAKPILDRYVKEQKERYGK